MKDKYTNTEKSHPPAEVFFEVSGGWCARDYASGDFLNAINDVVCWFQKRRTIRDNEIKAALQMYVNTFED